MYEMETTWNFEAMEVAYNVFGWTAFLAWACAFFPQVLLNFCRKSVAGLSFNFVLLNNTKHILYLIYNASLYFSPAVRFQYYQKYGFDQMIPVAANDVALSITNVVLTTVLLVQIAMYKRRNQSISKVGIGILFVVYVIVGVCFFIALPSKSWLWLISIFNIMQAILAIIKHSPQAFMNFMQKSTTGFSIVYVFLDICGGVTNYAQMVTQSIDQNSWVNFYGNIGKVLLCLVWKIPYFYIYIFFNIDFFLQIQLKETMKIPKHDVFENQHPQVCIFFDLVFMFQHYVLYPSKNRELVPPNKPITQPLVQSPDQTVAQSI